MNEMMEKDGPSLQVVGWLKQPKVRTWLGDSRNRLQQTWDSLRVCMGIDQRTLCTMARPAESPQQIPLSS